MTNSTQDAVPRHVELTSKYALRDDTPAPAAHASQQQHQQELTFEASSLTTRLDSTRPTAHRLTMASGYGMHGGRPRPQLDLVATCALLTARMLHLPPQASAAAFPSGRRSWPATSSTHRPRTTRARRSAPPCSRTTTNACTTRRRSVSVYPHSTSQPGSANDRRLTRRHHAARESVGHAGGLCARRDGHSPRRRPQRQANTELGAAGQGGGYEEGAGAELDGPASGAAVGACNIVS